MRSLGILALALLFVALPAAAQTAYDWSSAGACAVMPYASGSAVSGPSLTLASSFRGTFTSRFPVTNTYGSATSDTPPWTNLSISYTDDSSSGSVTANLYEVDKCTNTQTLICSVVSSDGSGPACGHCTFGSSTFDFLNNTYYVEVKLNRTTTAATEQLHSLGIN
ncbi:MAG TPA: hypothetical protein VFN10_22255 [Thermoanaerobaculia bacterium]|nr:hypothetical protein [Thermoanaerobaculia bacterium]